MSKCFLNDLIVTQSFATAQTVAYQAPLSMEFSRQEYWSGLPFPPPGDLPDPGIEPESSAYPLLVGGFFATERPGKTPANISYNLIKQFFLHFLWKVAKGG